MRSHPVPGEIGYLQLPTTDVERSARFFEAVFGWNVDLASASFEAPSLIGQWTTDLDVAGGSMLWITIDQLGAALAAVVANGGAVLGPPQLDQCDRWLVEVEDPAGLRIGMFAPARTAQAQMLLAVRDVEASSAWYQRLLGLTSDHGGPAYERLLADSVLVLQLRRSEEDHHHGPIGDPQVPLGNGVLVWFGEVADFDGVVARAGELEAPIVREPHRNPPGGDGVGPGHREIWISDPDGYTVVVASPDGEAYFDDNRPDKV